MISNATYQTHRMPAYVVDLFTLAACRHIYNSQHLLRKNAATICFYFHSAILPPEIATQVCQVTLILIVQLPCKANIRRTAAGLGIGLASPTDWVRLPAWSQIASTVAHTCLASYQWTQDLYLAIDVKRSWGTGMGQSIKATGERGSKKIN